ncbi:hypothetical protein LEN26_018572 [Aphanomyces euteiches]|nr:hypothetical protein LEN26_018572 [Aphanomyces euteiches]
MVSLSSIFLGLAFVATPSMAYARCNAPEVDTDYPGNDIRKTSQVNAADCCGDCAATPGCVVSTWSSYRGGTCWLKKSKATAVRAANVTSVSVKFECPALEADSDYAGNDISSTSRANATDCCYDCNTTPSCQLYVWTPSSNGGGTCWLKSAKGTKVPKLGAVAAATRMYSNRQCDALLENTDYAGHDIKSTTRSSVDQCCDDCKATVGCRLFVWAAGKCWLKDAMGAAKPLAGAKASRLSWWRPTTTAPPTSTQTPTGTPTATPSATPGATPSGTPGATPSATPNSTPPSTPSSTPTSTPVATPATTPAATAQCSVLSDNTDFAGNDIKATQRASADLCCDDCDKTTGCKLYVWTNHNGGTCWLKSGFGQRSTAAGAKAGAVKRECAALSDNTDYAGNDIGSTQRASAGLCCADCNATPGCKLYVWTNHNGGTCWLKSTYGKRSFALGAMAAATGNQCSPLASNSDYAAGDIGSTQSSSDVNCCGDCQATPGCKLYVWTKHDGGTCWLKRAIGPASAKNGATAGLVN